MKLEIGSGYNPTDGYEHLDADPKAPHLEYRGDVRVLVTKDYDIKLYPDLEILKTLQFDEVKAFHFIEHIQWIYQDALFNQFHSLLNEGGILNIETPDACWILTSYLKNRKKKKFPEGEHPDIKESGNPLQFWKWINFKIFSGCSPGDFHHCLYDVESLKLAVERNGLTVVNIKNRGGIIFLKAIRRHEKDTHKGDYYK